MQENDNLLIQYHKNNIKYFTTIKDYIIKLLNEDAKLMDNIGNKEDQEIKDLLAENSIYLYVMIQSYEGIIECSQTTLKELMEGEK